MSLALAAFAAICFGVQMHLVDYAMGREARTTGGASAVAAALLTLATGATVLWGLVLVRRGPITVAPVDLLPFVVAGVADPALSRVLAYEGIERVGPSVASAILAGSPAVAAVIAVPLLGETVTLGTGVGLVGIVVGVGALQVTHRSARTGSVDGGVDLLKRRLQEAAPFDFLYPVAGMVLIGAAFVVIKIGFRSVADALVGTATTQAAALASLVLVAARSAGARRDALVRDRVAFATLLCTGVVIAAGWFAMFLALQMGSVVTVLPLVSTYPLVVVIISYVAARELPRSARVLAAVAVIVVGAALIQAT